MPTESTPAQQESSDGLCPRKGLGKKSSLPGREERFQAATEADEQVWKQRSFAEKSEQRGEWFVATGFGGWFAASLG